MTEDAANYITGKGRFSNIFEKVKIMVDIRKEELRVRSLLPKDLPFLKKWLTDDRVLEFYGGRDQKLNELDIIREYYEEDNEIATRLIVECNDIPIGYVQVYDMIDEYYDSYHYDKKGEVVYCMDQFIGEPDYWNKGIGTRFMKMILEYLVNEKSAKAVILDPHQNNPRAVRVYEKAGFKIIKELPKHELREGVMEDCYLMEFRYDDNRVQ